MEKGAFYPVPSIASGAGTWASDTEIPRSLSNLKTRANLPIFCSFEFFLLKVTQIP